MAHKLLAGESLPRLLPAEPASLRVRWKRRPRRIPTIFAPALPALVLLAVTTAGMVDPPAAGLAAQLHVGAVTVVSPLTVTNTMPVTAR